MTANNTTEVTTQNSTEMPLGVKVAEAPLVQVPTTEQLVDLEREIQRLVERKRRTDLHIIDLESRIHAVETNFLKESAHFGAIVNGLEGYLAAVGGTPGRRTREEVKDADRLLSNTSSSQSRALAVHSRLVREGTLNPIPLQQRGGGNERKSIGSGSGSTNSSHRKRNRSNNDPAWSTPRRSRH